MERFVRRNESLNVGLHRFDIVKAGEAGLFVSSERLGVGLLGVNQVVNLNRHVR